MFFVNWFTHFSPSWLAGGYCTHSFRDHKEIVNTVQFHPDPYRLLLFSLSSDKTCKIFDLNEQKCVTTFSNHVSPPSDFALSTDGYLMVTAGRDKVNYPETIFFHSHRFLCMLPFLCTLSRTVFVILSAPHETTKNEHYNLDTWVDGMIKAHVFFRLTLFDEDTTSADFSMTAQLTCL